MDSLDSESPMDPQPGGAASPDQVPKWLTRLSQSVRIDFSPQSRPPSLLSTGVATFLAVVGSLAFDALCVRVATAISSSLRGYAHFQFSDYATLTVIGVVIACAGWPLVTMVSSSPRWLFFRSAILATLVLWLPDVWLLLEGQPPRAVGVLMVMHLGIAIVTYNALVRVARPRRSLGAVREPHVLALTDVMVRRIWSSMAILVAIELALGVATIVTVHFRRPNDLLPTPDAALYVAHGVVGVVLGVGALVVLGLSSITGRLARIGAVMGLVGVGIGLVGGLFATFQSTRLLGMGVMMVGVIVAGLGYIIPSLDAMGRAEAARAVEARDAMEQRKPTGPSVGASRTGRETRSIDRYGEFEAPRP